MKLVGWQFVAVAAAVVVAVAAAVAVVVAAAVADATPCWLLLILNE